MKTFLKVLLGLGLGIAALLAFVFWMTADLSRVADQFLTRIAANDFDGAMAMTTPDFRANTDRAALEAFVRRNGLAGYKSASWSSRSVNNNVGLLEGSLTVADGGVIPVTMNLVKGDDGWRIQNLKKADAGVATDSSASRAPAEAPAAPDAQAQAALINDTMSAFAASVNAGDFSGFHAAVSKRWQAQATADEMRDAFAVFIDNKIDLTVLEGMQPNIDTTAGIESDGSLHLTGKYATEPSVTSFDLRYEQDDGEWRIININVNVR